MLPDEDYDKSAGGAGKKVDEPVDMRPEVTGTKRTVNLVSLPNFRLRASLHCEHNKYFTKIMMLKDSEDDTKKTCRKQVCMITQRAAQFVDDGPRKHLTMVMAILDNIARQDATDDGFAGEEELEHFIKELRAHFLLVPVLAEGGN